MKVQTFVVQQQPLIYAMAAPGKWLLQRATPSWRIEDPISGFQRVVQERRARAIAVAVLEQQRTFPNAIVLATDRTDFKLADCTAELPDDSRFLVVDGQHRLWAQNFSDYEATYTCLVHMGLSEEEMATLFLEINDNQKRVPSSLRWDLVRLVRPDDDPLAIATADLIYSLATDEESPLYQRIDLTGEQAEITLKQGSLAPDIKRALKMKSPLHEIPLEDQLHVFTQFFLGIRDRDPDGWKSGGGVFYKARVIRALLRVLPELLKRIESPPQQVTAPEFLTFFNRISDASLDPEVIRAAQGNAGIRAIQTQVEEEMFEDGAD
jgi:DGQHR domain-containing protein